MSHVWTDSMNRLNWQSWYVKLLNLTKKQLMYIDNESKSTGIFGILNLLLEYYLRLIIIRYRYCWLIIHICFSKSLIGTIETNCTNFDDVLSTLQTEFFASIICCLPLFPLALYQLLWQRLMCTETCILPHSWTSNATI